MWCPDFSMQYAGISLIHLAGTGFLKQITLSKASPSTQTSAIFRVCWTGASYFLVRLTLGCRSSPQMCDSLSGALCWILYVLLHLTFQESAFNVWAGSWLKSAAGVTLTAAGFSASQSNSRRENSHQDFDLVTLQHLNMLLSKQNYHHRTESATKIPMLFLQDSGLTWYHEIRSSWLETWTFVSTKKWSLWIYWTALDFPNI